MRCVLVEMIKFFFYSSLLIIIRLHELITAIELCNPILDQMKDKKCLSVPFLSNKMKLQFRLFTILLICSVILWGRMGRKCFKVC